MMSGKTLFYYVLCVSLNLIAGTPFKYNQNDALNEYSDLSTDLENWMTKLPQSLRTVPIKNLAIPGSHDSFTSDITGQSDVSPDGEEILKILGQLKTAKVVIANWSKTQGLNVVGQLQAGISPEGEGCPNPTILSKALAIDKGDGMRYAGSTHWGQCWGQQRSSYVWMNEIALAPTLDGVGARVGSNPSVVGFFEIDQRDLPHRSSYRPHIGFILKGFFDLRFCRNSANEKLHFCHAMYSSEVQGVLTDLASYLSTHTQEVVILDCQHFYDFNTDTHNKVIQLLKDTFGNKMVPYQSNMESLTLEYLASQNKQVIVVYRDATRQGQDLLWPSESFPTPWYNTMDSSKLFPDLNNGISSRSTSVGHISQCILTPQVNDILAGLLSSLRRKCAVDFESGRTNWISNQTPGPRGVNIIINDFIELSDNLFSKTVINLNTKLSTNEVGVFGRIRQIASKIKHWF